MAEVGAAWVAGTVRARAIGRRRLGAAAVRELAASPSLAEAVEALAGSPYGRYVRAGDAQWAARRARVVALLAEADRLASLAERSA
jgi:hypothetical protein